MLANNNSAGGIDHKAARRGLRHGGKWPTMVPMLLLCFGALSIFLSHQSLGGGQEFSSAQYSSSMAMGGSSTMSLSDSLRKRYFQQPQQQQQQEEQQQLQQQQVQQIQSTDSFFQQFPPELYQEAWYLADEPDDTPIKQVYEDPHILQLLQNDSHIPFNLQRGGPHKNETALASAGTHNVLTALRDLDDVMQFFNPVCFRYRFPNISVFPTISVIVPMQNERSGLLALTVHSLLARTPPEILHEIIIIDDNGQLPKEREEVDEEEIDVVCNFHPKIICIRNQQKQGCAGGRLQGIRRATGEVIMVIDSHIEMYSSTWAQHLLLPILENPRTVAMQTLDSLEDLPGHKRRKAGAAQNYGVVSDSFLFAYVADRFKETGRGVERPTNRIPFETPFAPGSLFAMRRDEFWRLGGYDEGLAVWGGENTELAFKVYTCGYDGKGPPGRIVVVPCSRVGHVYRVNIKETGRWPPPLPDYVMKRYGMWDNPGQFKFKGNRADNFTKLVVRNNMRILYVWAGLDSDAMKGYYRVSFQINSTNPMDVPLGWRRWALEMQNDTNILKQLAIKKQNKCKSFEWFDKHVLYKLVGRHHPWHEIMRKPFDDPAKGPRQVSCGQHQARSCGACPQGNGATWCNGDCHWCEHGSVMVSNSRRNSLVETDKCVPESMACSDPAAAPRADSLKNSIRIVHVEQKKIV